MALSPVSRSWEGEEVASPFSESLTNVEIRKGRHRGTLILVACCLVFAVSTGVAGYFGVRYLNDPFRTLPSFPVAKYLDDYKELAGSKYAMARDFYAQCCQLGYPIMFKAEENLGHNSCIEVDQLRDDFFDYALALEKEKNDKGLDKAGIIALAAQRLNASPLIGDVLNQDLISTSDSQAFPPAQLVHLPNYQIAQAWATVHVPEQN
jgi:hypothetical protein